MTGIGKVALRDWVWQESGSKGTDRLVALALVERFNVGSGYAFPSIDGLEDLTGLSRETVINALRRLEAAGEWVKEERKHANTRYRPTLAAGAFGKSRRGVNKQDLSKIEVGSSDSDLAKVEVGCSDSDTNIEVGCSDRSESDVPTAESRNIRPEQELNRNGTGTSAAEAAPAPASQLPLLVAVDGDDNGNSAKKKDRSQAQLDSPGGLVGGWKDEQLGGTLACESRMRGEVSKVLKARYTPDEVRLALRRLAVLGKAEQPAALAEACFAVRRNPGLADFAGSQSAWEVTQRQAARPTNGEAAPHTWKAASAAPRPAPNDATYDPLQETGS